MNGKKTACVVVDALMTVMIVFEMFIQLTGDEDHSVANGDRKRVRAELSQEALDCKRRLPGRRA